MRCARSIPPPPLSAPRGSSPKAPPNRFRTGWWPLRPYLDRPEEALASELRETRNHCAHNATSDADDTYRAIDTMQRLATAIKDKKAVEELGARRNGVRIIQERKEDQAQSRPTAPQGTPPPPR